LLKSAPWLHKPGASQIRHRSLNGGEKHLWCNPRASKCSPPDLPMRFFRKRSRKSASPVVFSQALASKLATPVWNGKPGGPSCLKKNSPINSWGLPLQASHLTSNVVHGVVQILVKCDCPTSILIHPCKLLLARFHALSISLEHVCRLWCKPKDTWGIRR